MAMDQKTAFIAVFCSALQQRPMPMIPMELWADVLAMADRQHVYAMISEKMAEMPVFCAWEQYERVLQKAVRYTLTQEKREARLLWLLGKMQEAGLHPLVMKGMACRAAYGETGRLRPSGDEDLLISSREFSAAWNVLEACGYKAVAKAKPAHAEEVHHVLFEDENGNMLELHVRPIGLGNAVFRQMDAYFDGAHGRAVPMMWKGRTVFTLCPTDHYLLLIFHLVKHFYSLGFGIRPLADLAVYYTRYAGEIRQEEVYTALEACHLMPLYRDLVFIANRYLGFSLPEKGSALCPEELLAFMLDGGVLGKRNSTAVVASVMTNSSIEADHHPVKALWRMVFPPRENLLQAHPAYADLPLKWLLLYPRRWIRGAKMMLGKTTPLRSLKSSRERLQFLRRYGMG